MDTQFLWRFPKSIFQLVLSFSKGYLSPLFIQGNFLERRPSLLFPLVSVCSYRSKAIDPFHFACATEDWCSGSGCFILIAIRTSQIWQSFQLYSIAGGISYGRVILSSLSTLNGDWLLVPYSFIHICGFRIEARREIHGGIGLGVALAAIISMFALSNVSKVSSSYNLWHTSSTHGRASKRVNSLSTPNPYVLVDWVL